MLGFPNKIPFPFTLKASLAECGGLRVFCFVLFFAAMDHNDLNVS